LQYHPDRQAGKSDAEKKEAEEKFKEVNEAYSVLSDPDKRAHYDQFGTADESGFSAGGIDPFEFFRKMHAGFGMADDDGDGDFGFSPFGFSMGGSRRREAPDVNAPENGSDIQTNVGVSFKEGVFGCTKEFDFDLDKECPECHGTGVKKGSSPTVCPKCKGHGQVATVRRFGPMVSQQITTCPDCGGSGYSMKHCTKCGGSGRVAEKRHVKVKIPAGFSDGQRLRLRGLGRCGVKGGVNGDLYVVVRVGGSDLFTRDGLDVYLKFFVSPVMATLGGKVDVPTPYGYKKLTISPATASGTRMRIKGGGIKADSGTGDMFIDVEIEPYVNLTSEQKKLLEQISKTETAGNFAKSAELKRKASGFYG
jgi:molecular chaperone DnaJ